MVKKTISCIESLEECTRLNDKRNSRIIIIMQRLHENDLVGHLLEKGDWRVLRFPAIADVNEIYTIQTPIGSEVTYSRHEGDVRPVIMPMPC